MPTSDSVHYPWAPPLDDDRTPFLSAPAPGASSRRRFPDTPGLPRFRDATCCDGLRGLGALLRHPVNVAMAAWVLLAIPECVIIVLSSAGVLERSMGTGEAQKWVEICTQVVNALFVLTCLVVLPLLFRHVIQLCRWCTSDKAEVRAFYCRGGARKPDDRAHVSVVVALAQLACWARIAFSVVYWVCPPGARPAGAVTTLFALSWAAPAASMLYLLLSPLSKNYDVLRESDEPALRMYERSTAFVAEQRIVVPGQARWAGAVCPSCCADSRVAWCACLLPCCMFGYNAERLGFGHRAVHAAAFSVVLLGPVMVFGLSARSMAAATGVPVAVGVVLGLCVSFCGLGYGGLWRAQMRERYGLPGSCAGDVCAWMWCPLCALCQEIRTADQYDVREASLLRGSKAPLRPGAVALVGLEEEDLPHEDEKVWQRPASRPSRILPAGAAFTKTYTNPLAPQHMDY